jgi:hypothetical protein
MNVEKLKGTEIDKIESLEILCLSGRPVTEDKDVDTVRVLSCASHRIYVWGLR